MVCSSVGVGVGVGGGGGEGLQLRAPTWFHTVLSWTQMLRPVKSKPSVLNACGATNSAAVHMSHAT